MAVPTSDNPYGLTFDELERVKRSRETYEQEEKKSWARLRAAAFGYDEQELLRQASAPPTPDPKKRKVLLLCS